MIRNRLIYISSVSQWYWTDGYLFRVYHNNTEQMDIYFECITMILNRWISISSVSQWYGTDGYLFRVYHSDTEQMDYKYALHWPVKKTLGMFQLSGNHFKTGNTTSALHIHCRYTTNKHLHPKYTREIPVGLHDDTSAYMFTSMSQHNNECCTH